MLKAGANSCFRKHSEGGSTALHRASEKGHLPCVNLLLDTIPTKEGEPAVLPIQFPAVIDVRETVNQNTALHLAAAGGFTPVMTALTQRGAPLNVPNQLGNTPLHLACSTNRTLAARELIIAGADMCVLNKRGSTTLLFTIYGLPEGEDTVGLVAMLIEGGVDVNAQDSNGTTALHAAASKGLIKVAEMLLSSGADVTLKDVTGKDAAHYARVRGHEEVFFAINAVPREEKHDHKMVEIINASD
jgi:ankyrin repeat protein